MRKRDCPWGFSQFEQLRQIGQCIVLDVAYVVAGEDSAKPGVEEEATQD